jgi:hypothetical protein
MNKYTVKIGDVNSPVWGPPIEAKGFKEVKTIILDQIETLDPLNSSDEGREAYRNRFRGQPIFAKLSSTNNNFIEI